MEKKKTPNNITFNTVCDKLKSMRVNSVIKIWSDHWRPTMTTNMEQSPLLWADKAARWLKCFSARPGKWQPIDPFGNCSETLTFLAVLYFNCEEKSWYYARAGHWETPGDIRIWVLPCSCVWLQWLCLISCSRRTTLQEDQRGEAFKDP